MTASPKSGSARSVIPKAAGDPTWTGAPWTWGILAVFDSQAALITAVQNKQVDADFTDSAVVAVSLVQKPNPKIKLVTPCTPFFPDEIGAGVRIEDTRLLADLNAGPKELEITPEYVAILKKYGLTEQNAAK